MFLNNLFENQNWNIGFKEYSAENLIENKGIQQIRWMKHPYKDRFFADPFILKVTNRHIIVFVEELKFKENKGRLVELVIDRFSFTLIERYVLLELNTHLSYPIIFRLGQDIYVYPENSISGNLNLYKYLPDSHSLQYISKIIEAPLTDATIVEINHLYYLFATRLPNDKEDLIMYKSSCFMGNYVEIGYVEKGLEHSRMAGNFFEVKGELYRPSQNCSKRYGQGIEIMLIEQIGEKYIEHKYCSIRAKSFKYNLGIHTINFYDGICVVDGYGYLHPILGRLHHYYFKLRNLFS